MMVLVHGGGIGKECWDPLLPYLEGDVLAVELPGRGDRPGDLATIGIADFVDAVVDDLESRDLRDVVLVGHSLAGLTIPQVAARVPDRIRALVFVSCTVPADGQSTYDTLDPEIQAISDDNADPAAELGTLDPEVAKAVFYNDIDDPAVVQWALGLLVPEAGATVRDPMHLAGLPAEIPRVWVRLARDLIVAPEKQDRFAANLGGCDVVEIDAGHMVMISRPRELAEVLNRV
jgi:pimeloyl-ACP methyl ester carboxylesterase